MEEDYRKKTQKEIKKGFDKLVRDIKPNINLNQFTNKRIQEKIDPVKTKDDMLQSLEWIRETERAVYNAFPGVKITSYYYSVQEMPRVQTELCEGMGSENNAPNLHGCKSRYVSNTDVLRQEPTHIRKILRRAVLQLEAERLYKTKSR